MKHLSAQLISILISAGISVAAICMAACFCCVAAYSFLCQEISAPLAALSVAVLALIIGLTAQAIARAGARRLSARLTPPRGEKGGIGAELGQVFGAHLQDQVRSNPRGVIVALLAGGLALGVSGRLRKQIFRFIFH